MRGQRLTEEFLFNHGGLIEELLFAKALNLLGTKLTDLHKSIGSYAGYFERMAKRKEMWLPVPSMGLTKYRHIDRDVLLECDLSDWDNISVTVIGGGGVRHVTHKYTESSSTPIPGDTSVQVSYEQGRRLDEVDYAKRSIYIPAIGSTRHVHSTLDIDPDLGELEIINRAHRKSGVFDVTTGQLCNWSMLDTRIMCV